jgi:hypothetical protein
MVAQNYYGQPPNDTPPNHVLEWCQRLVAAIKDGGVWGIPRSGLIFRIDHKNKQLVLTDGRKEDEDFVATKHVFSFIGWDVVVEGKSSDAKNNRL